MSVAASTHTHGSANHCFSSVPSEISWYTRERQISKGFTQNYRKWRVIAIKILYITIAPETCNWPHYTHDLTGDMADGKMTTMMIITYAFITPKPYPDRIKFSGTRVLHCDFYFHPIGLQYVVCHSQSSSDLQAKKYFFPQTSLIIIASSWCTFLFFPIQMSPCIWLLLHAMNTVS